MPKKKSVLALLKGLADQHPMAKATEATARAGTEIVSTVLTVCNTCMGRPLDQVPQDIAAKRQNPNLL